MRDYCFAILLIISTCVLVIQPSVGAITENIAGDAALSQIIGKEHHNVTFEECTSVIITGSATKDGRPILMKNRDTSETANAPMYSPATSMTFAYVAVNTYWMGINEKGLALMNTAMPDLSEGHSTAEVNNALVNRRILQYSQSVAEVAAMLNDTSSVIGPGNRDITATCIGIIDRFGQGAFFEVSPTQAYVQYVTNGFDSRANHPRHFPGLASGPLGRDQYALDIMNDIYAQQGYITALDVARNVSRYVNHMEYDTTYFTIGNPVQISNPSSMSAMVAVSGDPRYDGRLNVMWGTYGNPPFTNIFLPSMVDYGTPPAILANFYQYAAVKRTYAQYLQMANYYDSAKVREIQEYTFLAEEFMFQQYEDTFTTLPVPLTDSTILTTIQGFIDNTVAVGAQIYIDEPAVTSSTLLHTQIPLRIIANSSVSNINISTTNDELYFTLQNNQTMSFCYVLIPQESITGANIQVIVTPLNTNANASTYNYAHPLLIHNSYYWINFTVFTPSYIQIIEIKSITSPSTSTNSTSAPVNDSIIVILLLVGLSVILSGSFLLYRKLAP